MKNPIIAVDFDGTLVENEFPHIGREVPDAIMALKRLVGMGWEILLLTMRSGEYLTEAVDWLGARGVHPDYINRNPWQHNWTASPKIYANLYVDDTAVGCPMVVPPGFNGPVVDWVEVMRQIEATNITGLVPADQIDNHAERAGLNTTGGPQNESA